MDPWRKRLSKADAEIELHRLGQALGPRYWRCTLGNYEIYDQRQAAVLDRLRAFAADMPGRLKNGGGLLLLGGIGCGKDHLAAALLKLAIVKHGLTVMWVDGSDLLNQFHEAVKGDWLPKLQANLDRPSILYVADIVPTRGAMTDAGLRRLRDTIDKRYKRTVSTWCSTNLDTRADAEAILTKPLLDRLRHNSEQIFCEWQSYRQRNQDVAK